MKITHILAVLALISIAGAGIVPTTMDYPCEQHRLYVLDMTELMPLSDSLNGGKADMINYWYAVEFTDERATLYTPPDFQDTGDLIVDEGLTCGAAAKYYTVNEGYTGVGLVPVIADNGYYRCVVNSSFTTESSDCFFCSDAEQRFNIGDSLVTSSGVQYDSTLYHNIQAWSDFYNKYYAYNETYNWCNYSTYSLPLAAVNAGPENYNIDLCTDWEYRICLNRYSKATGDREQIRCVICETPVKCYTGAGTYEDIGGEGYEYDKLQNCRVVTQNVAARQISANTSSQGAETVKLSDFMENPITGTWDIIKNSILAVAGFLTPNLPDFEACYDNYINTDNPSPTNFAVCMVTTLIGWFIITIIKIIFYYYAAMVAINRWKRAFTDSESARDGAVWVYVLFVIGAVAIFVLFGVNLLTWFKAQLV